MRSVDNREELPVCSLSPCAGGFLTIECASEMTSCPGQEPKPCITVKRGSSGPEISGRPLLEQQERSTSLKERCTCLNAPAKLAGYKLSDPKSMCADQHLTTTSKKCLAARQSSGTTLSSRIVPSEQNNTDIDKSDASADQSCTNEVEQKMDKTKEDEVCAKKNEFTDEKCTSNVQDQETSKAAEQGDMTCADAAGTNVSKKGAPEETAYINISKKIIQDRKCMSTKMADRKGVSGGHVVLPERYQQMLSSRRRQQSSASSSSSTGDLTTREKDLGTALAWIRQEMQQMKEQDKGLLKQFIDLRANILQLRCLYHYHFQSSVPDLSSLKGSSVSLNEAHKSPSLGLHHIARADSDLAVTSAGVKSASLPNSPQLFRFRWRSDEII